MSGFLRYPHLERLGGSEVEDILLGKVYAFYKIDGTNSSIWSENKEPWQVGFGSRNRELAIDNDNAGFMNAMIKDKRVWDFFMEFPDYRLYGEWLVPHSLKTYREDAWERFYVFDVWDSQNERFLSYEAYKPILEAYGFDYIPPVAEMYNPRPEQVLQLLEKTGQFLIKDGEGQGEGVVLKNYDWRNKYGRQTWAKVVSNDFKILNHKEMGAPIVLGTKLVEDEIVEKYVTEHFVFKEQAKIILRNREVGGIEWSNRDIPELLGRIFYELIKEEAYNFVKEFKNPQIDFKLLNKLTIMKAKKIIGL